MLIDIILAILLLIATYKGYKRGLVVGIFSLVAIIVGIAAAMKLSVIATAYLQQYADWKGSWLPILSFLGVFILVILIIRLIANAIEEGVKIVTLGWANKLGGILFYWMIFLIAYSVVIFYAVKLNLFSQHMIETSYSYSYLSPLGPRIIDGFALLVPFFKDMFKELETFFSRLGDTIPRP